MHGDGWRSPRSGSSLAERHRREVRPLPAALSALRRGTAQPHGAGSPPARQRRDPQPRTRSARAHGAQLSPAALRALSTAPGAPQRSSSTRSPPGRASPPPAQQRCGPSAMPCPGMSPLARTSAQRGDAGTRSGSLLPGRGCPHRAGSAALSPSSLQNRACFLFLSFFFFQCSSQEIHVLFLSWSAEHNESSGLENGLRKVAWELKSLTPAKIVPGAGAELQEQKLT